MSSFASSRILKLIQQEGRTVTLITPDQPSQKNYDLGVITPRTTTRKSVCAYLGKPMSADSIAVLGLQKAAVEGIQVAYISAKRIQGKQIEDFSIEEVLPGSRLEIDGDQWALQHQHTYTHRGRPLIYQFTLNKAQGNQ